MALAEKVITAEKIHIILLIDGINDLYLANYIITVVMWQSAAFMDYTVLTTFWNFWSEQLLEMFGSRSGIFQSRLRGS